MLTLTKFIFSWRTPNTSQTAMTSQNEDVSNFPATIPPQVDSNIVTNDNLPFWRRLLCAPEIPEITPQFSLNMFDDSNHVDKNDALFFAFGNGCDDDEEEGADLIPTTTTATATATNTSASFFNSSLINSPTVENGDNNIVAVCNNSVVGGGKDISSASAQQVGRLSSPLIVPSAAGKSLFADSLQQSGELNINVATGGNSVLLLRNGEGNSTRWTVTDTRRMCAGADDSATGGVFVNIAASSLHDNLRKGRLQLKEAQREQIIAEKNRRRQLRRAEEVLLENEQRRFCGLPNSQDDGGDDDITTTSPPQLQEEEEKENKLSSSSSSSSSFFLSTSSPSLLTPSANGGPSCEEKKTFLVERNKNSTDEEHDNNNNNNSFSLASDIVSTDDGDDDGSFIMDGDEYVDLKDLNRLCDYFNRRDNTVELSATQEKSFVKNKCLSSPSSSSSSTANSANNSINILGNKLRRKKQHYPLGSRKYIERVVLAQKSQQTIALLWLLAESMRHSCGLHMRLAQLYVNYVPIYLQTALAQEDVNNNEKKNEIVLITKNKYYEYYCSDKFDYEHYMYQFCQKWEALFFSVENYLYDDIFTCSGGVGLAATLLYSMELFERQRKLQLAVREVERWLRACWVYIYQATSSLCVPIAAPTRAAETGTTPSVPFTATTAEEKKEGEEKGEENNVERCVNCDIPISSPFFATDPAAVVNGDGDDGDGDVYIPMEWLAAQDPDVRARVSWNRKKRKLHQICLCAEALRQSAAHVGDGGSEGKDSDKSPSHMWGNDVLSAIAADCGDHVCSEKSHRVVNVGCFGFSFFSRWD